VEERGQATVEYLGISVLLLALLLGAGAVAAHAAPRAQPSGDAAYLPLAARYTPRMALERGGDGGEQPVDFRRCRRPACAHGPGVRPVLFLHAVRRGGDLYLEYWEYLPDSQLAHTGIPFVDGYHDDDWEGLIVKLRDDGTVVGARATAHLGFNGRHPWWDLARADWAPYPATLYRASGSHAGSFSESGIDVAGDRWSGTMTTVRPRLVAADEAARGDPPFASGAVAPWQKEAWTDPETPYTGRPGDHAAYARYARWWATLCAVC
jgi:hypothetical protein